MPIININVRRKKAISPLTHIVCGNKDYQISFNFDSEWDEYEVKTARFIWNGQYADVVFTGNVCDVPVISNAMLCAVGVYAGDLSTTTPAMISCDKSILCGDGLPAEPAPDVYAQIMELLNKEATAANVKFVEQELSEEQQAQARKNIGVQAPLFVTPQMFGAVADGVADDTNAVQAALDCGGEIYFPAGRYKVTRQLNAIKSCVIRMFKPYPATYLEEYPLTSEDNWMGARIETYATDGYGFLIGDAVEVDGLFLRAMDGFAGVLLKLDTTQGKYTYQAAVRISHVKLENNSATTIPESMFDFTPDGSYHYILNDIAIGRSPSHPRCRYGFRADLSGTPRKWCNNVFVRNMCIDVWADVALYIDGARVCAGWVFDGLTVQAYNFDPGHVNLLNLKNMTDTLFVGSYLWDTGGVSFSDKIITQESVKNTTCMGCSADFDAIETGLKAKMNLPENLNITNLEMSVAGDEATGAHILTLTDGKHERNVSIPGVVISEEQVGTAVSNWMDENAAPIEVVGRNKFNPDSDCVFGYYYNNPNNDFLDTTGTMWMTNLFEVKVGDIIRLSQNGVVMPAWGIYIYNADKKRIGSYDVYAGNSSGIDYKAIEVLDGVEHSSLGYLDFSTAKYARLSINGTYQPPFDDRHTAKICITVNNTDLSYEPYGTTFEGGIGSLIKLQSPNGTRYSISVDDNGQLYAKQE